MKKIVFLKRMSERKVWAIAPDYEIKDGILTCDRFNKTDSGKCIVPLSNVDYITHTQVEEKETE